MHAPVVMAALNKYLGRSPWFWRELAVVAVILLLLQSLEPAAEVWIRDALTQNASDTQLHDLADDVVVQALLCRRFEKDVLLNLSNEPARSAYFAQWERAVTDLDRAITQFGGAAQSEADRAQADRWRASTAQYRRDVVRILQDLDRQGIDDPAYANQRLSTAKDDIRLVSDTAQTVALEKERAAHASGLAIQQALITGMRIAALALLAASVVYIARLRST